LAARLPINDLETKTHRPRRVSGDDGVDLADDVGERGPPRLGRDARRARNVIPCHVGRHGERPLLQVRREIQDPPGGRLEVSEGCDVDCFPWRLVHTRERARRDIRGATAERYPLAERHAVRRTEAAADTPDGRRRIGFCRSARSRRLGLAGEEFVADCRFPGLSLFELCRDGVADARHACTEGFQASADRCEVVARDRAVRAGRRQRSEVGDVRESGHGISFLRGTGAQ
jgi:hypothetical protein